MKVFLGGTCSGSTWRDEFTNLLTVEYFNPVVEDWDEEAQLNELKERETCDFVLYCITPKMEGVYSIAEAVDDSNKRPTRTIFIRVKQDGSFEFSNSQWKSLSAVSQMIKNNGGNVFSDLKSAAIFINNYKNIEEG